ncbi:MAG: undecaprenyl/decaprenyl-phosphate alpha-N-acetylglucosaminyl 1-phosphate transferase [Euzebyales bacterium]|nr:undecaprenyl/decaprenyl-phosphate alpha-N-acetylglucosaminyl 1-phosphate transferase [Euzebyales bacterium]
MIDYLIVGGVAFVTVLCATPAARWVSHRLGAVDRPGGRRVHTSPTPRLGGLALLLGFLAAVAAASRLSAFDGVFATTSDPEAIVLAACAIFAVGLIDDVRGVSAPAKLAGQILAAGTLVIFGVSLRYVFVPGEVGTVVLSGDLAALLTILAIVAMINAVNLVDGLDGLAVGIVGIAAVALFAYVELSGAAPTSGPPALSSGLPASAELVFAALIGLCAGFLVFNTHPASVFMGDSGAMLLGLLLGSAGVLAVGGTIQPSGRDFAALSVPILVPVLVLAVPFVDTATTILRRLLSGRALFSPDKKHLHHRLIEIGHSHRRAVLIMYYWSALFAFAAVGIGLLPRDVVGWATVTGVGVGTVVLLASRVRGRHARRGDKPVGEFVLSFTKAGDGDPKTPAEQGKRAHDRL